MGCGVPIVSYGNDAFQGLAKTASVGWGVPVGKPLEMAKCIADIYHDPTALRDASLRSLEFASAHTFESTFRGRVDHLDLVMKAFIKEHS